MKQKAFLTIFKELSVTTACLRPGNGPFPLFCFNLILNSVLVSSFVTFDLGFYGKLEALHLQRIFSVPPLKYV